MTEDRKRAEDVYALLEEHREWVVGQFNGLSELTDEIGEMRSKQIIIEETVDVLADSVIGDKIPDPYNPSEWKLNGKGRPERDTTTGLAYMARKLRWQNQLWKFIGQLAAMLTGVALIVSAYGGS